MSKDLDFIEENKDACIQEIGIQIQQLNTFLGEVANMQITENDAAEVRNYFMLMGHSIGYLTAVYNEYMALKTGVLKYEPPKPIGFSSLSMRDKE